MPPVFSKRHNTLLWALLVLVVVVLGGIPIFLMIWVRTPMNTGEGHILMQPVEFDHRHHTADAGIDCRYCHWSVERSRHAGIPATSLCMNCHNQIWPAAASLQPVRESFFLGQPLRWPRVYKLGEFTYFDHSQHVVRGVACESCHGRVDQMARVFQVVPLTMGWCLDCHRDFTPHLRPQEHITTMGWGPPEQSPRQLGEQIAETRNIQPPQHCSACHR